MMGSIIIEVVAIPWANAWYVYNRFKQLGTSVDEFMGNGSDWEEKDALG